MKTRTVLIDTDIILYAYDRNAYEKHSRALLKVKDAWNFNILPYICTSTLQECISEFEKYKIPKNSQQAIIKDLAEWNLVILDKELILSASEISFKYRLEIRDAIIVAAAERVGVTEIWSEKLGNRIFGNIRSLNVTS